MKLISQEIKERKEYGTFIIKTRLGELEYSYSKGFNVDDDNDYQLETSLSDYHKLSDDELNEIDDLIMDKIYNSIKLL